MKQMYGKFVISQINIPIFELALKITLPVKRVGKVEIVLESHRKHHLLDMSVVTVSD